MRQDAGVPQISEVIFTAIDFESAGTSPGVSDAPVQVGVGEWSVEAGLREPWVSFLHCDQPITWAAQKVHGISADDLREAPRLLSLWPLMKRRLGVGPVVAHGSGTERRFLRVFPGHDFGPWIDTLHLARAAWPGLPSYSLGDLCGRLGLEDFAVLAPGRGWHDALYDALASLAICEHLIRSFRLEEAPLEDLLSPDTTRWKRLRQP